MEIRYTPTAKDLMAFQTYALRRPGQRRGRTRQLAGLAACQRSTFGAAAATGAWTIQVLTFLPAVRHQRAPALFAWTLPVSACFYGFMTAFSAWRYWRSGGTEWKRRRL